MPLPEITTARSVLRPVAAADVPVLHALWTDAEVRRYLFDGRTITRDEAGAFVAESQRTFATARVGLWVLGSSGEARPHGFVGFRRVAAADRFELLYGLLPDAWGRGIALAAARTALRYAFEVARLPVVEASVDVPNRRSVRLLERVGMRYVRGAIVRGLPLAWYEIAPGEHVWPGGTWALRWLEACR